jgi:hypothetical protein
MIFFHPSAFLWLLLAIPIALLYLRPHRPTRVVVSTGYLWAKVFPENAAFSAWRKRRRWLSLALQLTALGLVVAALAEPSLRPAESIVVVIDNRTADDHATAPPMDQATWFAGAKRVAAARVDAMEDHDQAALLSTGDVLRVRCGLTGSRDDLHRAIDSLEPVASRAGVEDALRLAHRLLGAENGRILLIADRSPQLPADADQPGDVERLSPRDLGKPGRWARMGIRPPLWSILAAAAIAVLAIEWGLFHRRWTE